MKQKSRKLMGILMSLMFAFNLCTADNWPKIDRESADIIDTSEKIEVFANVGGSVSNMDKPAIIDVLGDVGMVEKDLLARANAWPRDPWVLTIKDIEIDHRGGRGVIRKRIELLVSGFVACYNGRHLYKYTTFRYIIPKTNDIAGNIYNRECGKYLILLPSEPGAQIVGKLKVGATEEQVVFRITRNLGIPEYSVEKFTKASPGPSRAKNCCGVDSRWIGRKLQITKITVDDDTTK